MVEKFECMECDTELKNGSVMMNSWNWGKYINCVTEVLFCPNCGERYYSRDQLKKIEEQNAQKESAH